MENVYAGHGSERSKVLCTVEFGLACTRRVSSLGSDTCANGVDAIPPPDDVKGGTNGLHGPNGLTTVNGSEGVLTRNLLLKPKVLLESVAEIL
ncbi:hypothetical protein A0H81_07664 [Grifola frondosa]|uniref:Uncharacterized protein n=1 Tax=Grifola frondosa TaxID=5627 RepID=A0A1C7M697_GRIFR|nr:hypothetical protein A0H81_07664 [Grifola frondosa]